MSTPHMRQTLVATLTLLTLLVAAEPAAGNDDRETGRLASVTLSVPSTVTWRGGSCTDVPVSLSVTQTEFDDRWAGDFRSALGSVHFSGMGNVARKSKSLRWCRWTSTVGVKSLTGSIRISSRDPYESALLSLRTTFTLRKAHTSASITSVLPSSSAGGSVRGTVKTQDRLGPGGGRVVLQGKKPGTYSWTRLSSQELRSATTLFTLRYTQKLPPKTTFRVTYTGYSLAYPATSRTVVR